MFEDVVERLTIRLDQWREANVAVDFSPAALVSVPPHRSGEYLTDKRDFAVVVHHPASNDPDETFQDASRWLMDSEAHEPEQLSSYHLMLQTDLKTLSQDAIQLREAHARAFAQAWLDRVMATHGIRAQSAPKTLLDLRIELSAPRHPPELSMDTDEVAHVIQRLYGQKHPERALAVRFVVAGSSHGPAFTTGRYLRGFQETSTDSPTSQESDPEFLRAFEFASRWCNSIEAAHNLYSCDFQMGSGMVHVLRDDVSPELYLDEEEAAAAIQARFHETNPGNAIQFIGEYCK